MTYQPLDDNNDGVVDADVDNEKVSTMDLNNTQWVPPAEGAQGIRDRLSAGATVSLHSGATYLAETDGVQLPDGATLYINGATLKNADGVTPNWRLIGFDGVSNASVIGPGTIDPNRPNTSDTGFHQEGVCVAFNNGAADNRVANLELTSPWYRHIISYQSTDNTVENVTFRDLGSECAMEFDHGTEGTALRGATVHGDGATGEDGVLFDQNADPIRNNLVEGVTCYNVDRGIGSGGLAGRGNRVVDSEFINCDQGVQAPRNGRVENVEIFNPGSKALNLQRNAEAQNVSIYSCFTGAVDVREQAVLDGLDLHGGFGTVHVYGDDASVRNLTGNSVNGKLLVVEAGVQETQVVDCHENIRDHTTTLAASASGGASQITLSDHAFDIGQKIGIVLDDSSVFETFILDIVDDATFGSGDIVSLRASLPSPAASGNTVANVASANGIDINGTDPLVDGCYTQGGVDVSGATNPTTGTNV